MPASNPRLLWPVTVTAATNDTRSVVQNFRFREGAGPELTALLTTGDYSLRGGGTVGTDLLAELQTRLNAAGANTYEVSRTTTGRVRIRRTAGVATFTLLWSTGTDPQFDGTVLGFNIAADDGPTTDITSDFQSRFVWHPSQLAIDGYRWFPTATAGVSRSLAGQQYTQQWATSRRGVLRIEWVRVAKVRTTDVDGELQYTAGTQLYEQLSNGLETSWEGFYESARAGRRFEIAIDEAATGSAFLTAVIDHEAREWFEDFDSVAEVIMERGERYRVTIPWELYTA